MCRYRHRLRRCKGYAVKSAGCFPYVVLRRIVELPSCCLQFLFLTFAWHFFTTSSYLLLRSFSSSYYSSLIIFLIFLFSFFLASHFFFFFAAFNCLHHFMAVFRLERCDCFLFCYIVIIYSMLAFLL